jgi:hypothetical protein
VVSRSITLMMFVSLDMGKLGRYAGLSLPRGRLTSASS